MENGKVKEGKKVQLWIVLLVILVVIAVGITGIFVIKDVIEKNKPKIYTNLIKMNISEFSKYEIEKLEKISKIIKTKNEYDKIRKDVFGIIPQIYASSSAKAEKFPVYDEQFFVQNSLVITYAERTGPDVVDDIERVRVKDGILNIKFAPHNTDNHTGGAYVYLIEIPKKNIEGVDKLKFEYTNKLPWGVDDTFR